MIYDFPFLTFCFVLSVLALDIIPNDPKALFRRCQAFEGLERPEDAYKDAMMLLRVEPKNKAIQPLLMRLQPIIQAKVGTPPDTWEIQHICRSLGSNSQGKYNLIISGTVAMSRL